MTSPDESRARRSSSTVLTSLPMPKLNRRAPISLRVWAMVAMASMLVVPDGRLAVGQEHDVARMPGLAGQRRERGRQRVVDVGAARGLQAVDEGDRGGDVVGRRPDHRGRLEAADLVGEGHERKRIDRAQAAQHAAQRLLGLRDLGAAHAARRVEHQREIARQDVVDHGRRVGRHQRQESSRLRPGRSGTESGPCERGRRRWRTATSDRSRCTRRGPSSVACAPRDAVANDRQLVVGRVERAQRRRRAGGDLDVDGADVGARPVEGRTTPCMVPRAASGARRRDLDVKTRGGDRAP